MPAAEAAGYHINPFDLTKVWPHNDYPLLEVGRLVLDRNPDNYFADVEQAAFDPANFVPGIGPSPDKMLQGRLFAYGDAHRYRLGINHTQLPVNSPHAAEADNYGRDGRCASTATRAGEELRAQQLRRSGGDREPLYGSLGGDGPGHLRVGQARERRLRPRPARSTASCPGRPRPASSTTSPPAWPRFPRTTSSSDPSPTSLMPIPITALKSRWLSRRTAAEQVH